MLARRGDGGKFAPQFFAERVAVGVGHERDVGRLFEGERPALEALFRRLFAGDGLTGGFRQPREDGLVFDFEDEPLGVVEDVFGKFLRLYGKLRVYFAQTRLFVWRELCAAQFEVEERLG